MAIQERNQELVNLLEADFFRRGDLSFNEMAQAAVGAILVDSDRITLIYNPGVPSIVADVVAASVANSFLANMAQATVKGRSTGAGTGAPVDLTATQLIDIIETADGAGSGLDADMVDGQHASAFEGAGAVAAHAALTVTHGATGAIVGETNTQTLTNKTLTTPAIGNFTNAQHNHANAAGGGQLTTASLSNYAEGTWIPAITGATSNPTLTYVDQLGKYTRIGNVVVWSFRIALSAASGGSGGLRISLPFTANVDGATFAVRTSNFTYTGTPVTAVFTVSNGNAFGNIRSIVSAAGGAVEPVTNLASNTIIESSGVMFV